MIHVTVSFCTFAKKLARTRVNEALSRFVPSSPITTGP